MASAVRGGASGAPVETFSVTVSFSEFGRLHHNIGKLNE
jgi:hypothetical protein